MNKRLYIYLPVFFALTLIAGIFLGGFLQPSGKNIRAVFKFGASNKFNDVLEYILSDYVDTVDRNTLTEKAIIGLLHSLDPHSAYIRADDFNEANDPLKGNFDGIGVQFRVIRDTITVINVVPGGPSEAVGLQGGDRIVKIDNKNVAGIKIKDTEVMKKLKGPRGTKVLVTVYRKYEKKFLNFNITRNVIPTYSVDIAYMINSKVGYIKLSKFSATTPDEISQALNKLKRQGMQKLIFDLRGNGGGYLDAAVSIADEFLAAGKLIVYTEGAHRPRKNYYATKGGLYENQDIIVLIDEFSASASEIVAGAIQDNDRGLIIGRRSFGKGLVQEQIQLSDGSAVRLTVARYHTPTGRCIQKPYSEDYEEYYNEFYNRLLQENPDIADSLNFADTVRYSTPKGKIVYGGGGIMPDIYIPYKSEIVSDYYRKVINKGLLVDFCFDYADKNRNTLKKYNTPENFIKNFSLSENVYREFLVYAESKGIEKDEQGQNLAKPVLMAYIKAFIGRNIFDDPAFYPVILPYDVTVQKALKIYEEN